MFGQRFKGKKIIVMGLGLHGGGIGVTKFLCREGAEVLVTDLKTKKELKDSLDKLKNLPVKFALGGHREDDFKDADLVIKNPDVPGNSPFLKIARKNGVPVKNDIGIFFDLSKAFIIGVTGSKGKSTVASLIYHLLKKKYPKTYLAGNIGSSPLELCHKKGFPKDGRGAKVVLELSSFELEDLKKSPQIAVFTNIFREHLNRYRGMKDYISAKKKIYLNQSKEDILLLNHDDILIRRFSFKSKVRYFSQKTVPDKKKSKSFGCFLNDGKIYFNGVKKPVSDLDGFKLAGEHNVSNLLASVSVAKILGVSDEMIEKSIKSFKGVSGRQEYLGEKDGVKYFNDTTATMPEAVQKGIDAMKEKFPNSNIILIAGGMDKNLDYRGLVKSIKTKVSTLVLLPGTASDKIKKGLGSFKYVPVKSMKEAVRKASGIAKKGDIVVLSPGATSFNLFKNEFDRGDSFVERVGIKK